MGAHCSILSRRNSEGREDVLRHGLVGQKRGFYFSLSPTLFGAPHSHSAMLAPGRRQTGDWGFALLARISIDGQWQIRGRTEIYLKAALFSTTSYLVGVLLWLGLGREAPNPLRSKYGAECEGAMEDSRSRGCAFPAISRYEMSNKAIRNKKGSYF